MDNPHSPPRATAETSGHARQERSWSTPTTTPRRRPARALGAGAALGLIAGTLAALSPQLAAAAAPPSKDGALPGNCAQTALTVDPVVCVFGYTGGEQAFTVPAGVTAVQVEASGGDGGGIGLHGPAVGSTARATLDVAPGSTLYVEVGGAGESSGSAGWAGAAGGWNGGGPGGAGLQSIGAAAGAGGGGATDVRTLPRADPGTLASRLLVAAGAGGDGGTGAGGGRGDEAAPAQGDTGGKAGSATAPGAGGTFPGGPSGHPGALASGGGGSDALPQAGGGVYLAGGGGGAGWFGGGGGTSAGGGGGGSRGPAGAVFGHKATPGPAGVTISYAPQGPITALRLTWPAGLVGRVGVPLNGFRVLTVNGDGANVGDVTDVAEVVKPDGDVCVVPVCVFDRPGIYPLTIRHQGVSIETTASIVGDPRLTASGGDGQVATRHATFAEPLRATLVDAFWDPAPRAVAVFRASGPAAFEGGGRTARARTDRDGTATAPALVAGGRLGEVTVVVTVPREDPRLAATFTLAVIPDDPPPPIRERCAGVRATIVGTPRDDVLVGTARRDVAVLKGGDDVFRGRGGDDLVCGGPGADRLVGGPADDRVLGGPGADRMAGTGGVDVLSGGAGADRLLGGVAADVEHGGPGADAMWGGDQGDRMFGEAGPDRMWGGPGDDFMRGGPGRNVVHGGPGHNNVVATAREPLRPAAGARPRPAP